MTAVAYSRPMKLAGASIVGTPRPGSGNHDPSFGSTEAATPRRPQPKERSLSGLTKLEFGHACGEHGIRWEGTIVCSVSGQARKLGVRPGWKIHMIDGHVVQDEDDVFLRLQEAKWQWRSCYVWFITDFAAIRAEQSAARAAKIKEEMERLAKLPFEGAHDNRHLGQLREAFPYQGCIDRVEDRGITLGQLQQVLQWAKSHCHRWRDAAPGHLSKTARQQLHFDFMNLHHINHWLVKPATQEKNCSLVELLTGQKQAPSWYVVHWWGERVADFLTCMELHVSTRKLPESASFWIDAYSNRQHSMHDVTADDPRKSCFFRGIAAANFQVLAILDWKANQNGGASVNTLNTRTWCVFEQILCLDSPRAAVDIVTCYGHRAIGVTAGLTAEEQDMERSSPGSGWRAKSDRERTFGLDIIESCLSVQLQTTWATETADRHRLLNCVAERDLDQPPLDVHELYSRANRRLRALYALSFWRRIMAGTADSDMHRIQIKLADALRNDTWRETLDVSMAFPTGEDKMALLAKSYPPNLKELKLNLRGMNMTNENMVTLASGFPKALEDLTLDLSHNADISNVGISNLIGSLPPKLKEMSLELASTEVTKDLLERRHSLDQMQQYITDEQQKGASYVTMTLNPSANRRMVTKFERGKV